MDAKRLSNIIKKEEGTKLDYKQKLDISTESGRKELAKDICAIANSKGGRGYIIIGIEDKSKNIIGINKNDYKEEQIQQIVSSRCEPPIPVSYEVINYENRCLGVINIYDGPQRPYQMRESGGFYIRRGSTTDTMRKQELMEAFQENLNFNAELCPIVKSGIGCIDKGLVKKYFASKGMDANEDRIEELMESSSILQRDKESNRMMATLGGLLVFSKENYVYIPHNMIRIVNKVNVLLEDVIYIKGDLLTMIDSCQDIIKSILPDNYPTESIGEGIKNAVLYRDYGLFDRNIEIIVDYKNITLISPGAIISRNEKYNPSFSRRNMWIYEKLTSMDDTGRFKKNGGGFYLMKKVFKNKEKVKFINSSLTNSFKIIYPGISQFS
jgi:predicted HTH transcriptional regulator